MFAVFVFNGCMRLYTNAAVYADDVHVVQLLLGKPCDHHAGGAAGRARRVLRQLPKVAFRPITKRLPGNAASIQGALESKW